MSQHTHPDWDVVVRLGGAAKVATLMGWSVQRVQNWKQRGIPSAVKVRRPDLFMQAEATTKRKPKATTA
jgi:hypothetical protein